KARQSVFRLQTTRPTVALEVEAEVRGPTVFDCHLLTHLLSPLYVSRHAPAAHFNRTQEKAMQPLVRCTGLLALLLVLPPLKAQLPANLANKKDFRALRLASTDPKFKNADYRRIAPGQTLDLGKIEGHGRITHIWFTIAAESTDHLRELVFRIYWDGADRP